MLGLLFAAVLACPINQHPCDDDVNARAAAPAYAPAYHDNRVREDHRYDDPRYDDQRHDGRRYQDQDYPRQDDERRHDQGAGQTVVRETTTADGVVRETWGPKGYVRETFGFDDPARRPAYDQRQAYEQQPAYDQRDGRDYRADDRGPGVYDRYGAPYQGGRYYDRSDAYGASYDPNCNCDCPPGVTAAPVAERETVDIRGWGMVGGVQPDGDYYSGGGGGGASGGGVDMNGLAFGANGSGLGGGAGSGFGRGSASASASVSVSTSVGVGVFTGGVGGHQGGGHPHGGGHSGGGSSDCGCSTSGSHSSGGGKRW
jgi:hypothetical protein